MAYVIQCDKLDGGAGVLVAASEGPVRIIATMIVAVLDVPVRIYRRNGEKLATIEPT